MNSSTESPTPGTLPSTSEIKWGDVPIIDPRIPLDDAILTYLRKQPDAECVKYVEKFMVFSLSEFVQEAITKFIDGQKEHGGDFREVDHHAEAKKERTDSFWYGAGADWKERNL